MRIGVLSAQDEPGIRLINSGGDRFYTGATPFSLRCKQRHEYTITNARYISPGIFRMIKTTNKIAYLIYCITFVCN